MIGVKASRARGATLEDVVGIEVKRQTTVEQVGGQTAIHAPIRLVDHQHVLATTAIVGVDIYLKHFPKFGPEIQTNRITNHLVFNPFIGTELHLVVVVEQHGIEADVHEIGRANRGVQFQAFAFCCTDVDGLREIHLQCP